MPLGSTVPAWYNDNYYINEKVDECNAIKFGAVEGEEFTPWTEASVRDFMAAANGETSYAPWMGYDNFVSNGNAEFCSPNPLFNVMQYLYAKANQLNALNDGAGYGDNANNWTGQLVLDFFKANNISAWDHFTTSGQFEGINPSNAMDLSEFLDKKAAQCNEMKFDDRDDWNAPAVLDYLRAHNINAVEVAVNDRDPNVVAVPEGEGVTVPAGLTPWGPAGSTLVPVELTKGVDDVTDHGVPTNFIGTVATSTSESTFNANDKITGTNTADELTVTLNSSFNSGMKDGSVKGVPTVNLVATSDESFNTAGIEDVTTWNMDGQISLSNLAAPGITANYSNVYAVQDGVRLAFLPTAVAGPSDSLTLGVENVYVPNQETHQPSDFVDVTAQGIEDLTVNSTGVNRNMINTDNVSQMNSLTVTGEGNLAVENGNSYLKTIDATAATGNVAISSLNSKIAKAAFGTGNDSLTVAGNLVDVKAEIDGGEGEDTLTITQADRTYAFDMQNVETLAVNGNAADVTFVGSNVQGLKNLELAGTTDGAPQNDWDITLSEFGSGELDVQAIGPNSANLNIKDLTNIDLRVGDGVKSAVQDTFTGNLTLGNANSLTIDITDTDDSPALFNSYVRADQVTDLKLNASAGSELTFAPGSELSQLASIHASGFGFMQIGGEGSNIGTKAQNIQVNTQAMANGSFKGMFDNNTQNATLNVEGSNMIDNWIGADGTFKGISMTTGQGDDTLELTGSVNAPLNVTSNNFNASLGDGYDRVIVNATADEITQLDFKNFNGIERFIFTEMDKATVDGLIDNKILNINPDLVSTSDYYGIDVETSAPFTDAGTEGNDNFYIDTNEKMTQAVIGGAGGMDTFQTAPDASINSPAGTLTMEAGLGSVTANFLAVPATAANPGLYIEDLKTLNVVNGGNGNDNLTGTIANVNGQVNIDLGGGKDTVNLTAINTPDAAVKLTANSDNTSTDLKFGDITANSIAIDGLRNTGNVTLGDVTVASTNGVNLATNNVGDFTAGNIVAGQLADDGKLAIDANVTVSAANVGTVTLGNITANGGNVAIATNGSVTDLTQTGTITAESFTTTTGYTGQNVPNGFSNTGDVSLGTIDTSAADGAVNIDANNGGDLTIADIQTGTGTATINTEGMKDSDTAELTAGTVGTLNWTGGDVKDVINATVTGGTINTGGGNDSITLTANSDTNATVTINTGASDTTTGDTVSVTAGNSLADKITTVDITAGEGKDTITVGNDASTVGGAIFELNGLVAGEDVLHVTPTLASLSGYVNPADPTGTAMQQLYGFLDAWHGGNDVITAQGYSLMYATDGTHTSSNWITVTKADGTEDAYTGLYALTSASDATDANAMIHIVGSWNNVEAATYLMGIGQTLA